MNRSAEPYINRFSCRLPTSGWVLVVSIRVVFGVLTTVAAFSPLMMVGGQIGQSWQRTQQSISEWLDRLAREHYGPALSRALTWRYTSVAVAFALLILGGALLQSGYLGFQFFEPWGAESVSTSLTMVAGTPIDRTEAAVERLERAVETLRHGFETDRPQADREP